MEDSFKKELKKFIQEYREKFEARPLMFGGTLSGIEAIWHTISTFENFVYEYKTQGSYAQIAKKYKCGSWVLSSKVEEEFREKDLREASEELIKRLQEVRQLTLKFNQKD